MTDTKGILIYCETQEAGLTPITIEQLGAGQKLATQLGEEVLAVLVGSGIDEKSAHECIYYGADKVYVIDREPLESYSPELYSKALETLIERIKPSIVLFGQTTVGRDLAPRLAYKLNTGVTLDCVDLTIDPSSRLMLQTKPVYGGKAYGVYVCESKPQIVTIRPKSFPPMEKNESKKGEIILFDLEIDFPSTRAKVVSREKEKAGIQLEAAKVVICAGRGVARDDLGLLRELANLFNGAVGCTRPVCDDGRLPPQHQIGLTGKIVNPDLYIGIAVSGATQHLAGIMGSKIIVAVNKDPDAPIFRVAHYGIVGDYREVVPSIINKCKELKKVFSDDRNYCHA
ncbi:MAG: electron transfer flavoprotein subunit alpha [Deltaproteobacteria bacterium]|nr:MAG: electron transfer flavoprotein subunit alpha [Deltaproteobacteria bacterium]